MTDQDLQLHRFRAELMDQLFKYKIGQFLRHKGYKPFPNADEEGGKDEPGWRMARSLLQEERHKRPRLLVMDRVAQECNGGVQLHYVVRPGCADGNFSSNAVQLREDELEPEE